MIEHINTAELRSLAEECQTEIECTGRWHVPERGNQEWLYGSGIVTSAKTPRGIESAGRVLVQANTNFQCDKLIAHVAANDPPTVLGLLDHIERCHVMLEHCADVINLSGMTNTAIEVRTLLKSGPSR